MSSQLCPSELGSPWYGLHLLVSLHDIVSVWRRKSLNVTGARGNKLTVYTALRLAGLQLLILINDIDHEFIIDNLYCKLQ